MSLVSKPSLLSLPSIKLQKHLDTGITAEFFTEIKKKMKKDSGGVEGYKATSQAPSSSDYYVRAVLTVAQYAFIST